MGGYFAVVEQDTGDAVNYALGFAAYYLSFSVFGQRWRMLARNTGELDGLAQSRLSSMASSAVYIIIGSRAAYWAA